MSLEITHHFIGDDYAKLMRIEAGAAIVTHAHNADHNSALLAGKVVLFVDGVESIHEAPAVLRIVAGQQHAIKALTPTLWACLWKNPEGHTDPAKIDMEVTS